MRGSDSLECTYSFFIVNGDNCNSSRLKKNRRTREREIRTKEMNGVERKRVWITFPLDRYSLLSIDISLLDTQSLIPQDEQSQPQLFPSLFLKRRSFLFMSLLLTFSFMRRDCFMDDLFYQFNFSMFIPHEFIETFD